MNYAKTISNVPQNQPLPQYPNMVKNNAGGYGFEVSDEKLVERFLVLGTEGGTYYVGQEKLTVNAAKTIISLIQKDGLKVLNILKEVENNNRAIKKSPVLFVLALLATYGNESTKLATYNEIKNVCRTSTHLFDFINNIHELRGWSRGLRRGVSQFYTSKTSDQIAYQMVKYKSRNGVSHRDVLRLAHTIPNGTNMQQLFSYAVGKSVAEETNNALVIAAEKAAKSTSEKEVISLVKEHNLTWEMIPTSMLNSKAVQAELLKEMPLTALLRNLNRFTNSGLFESRTDENTNLAVSKLTNKEEVIKAKLHPVNVLNTIKIYERGYGDKGSLRWIANQAIVDALQETFELSFKAVTPTNKKILVGVDVSGSMNSPIAGMALTASEAAGVMAMTILRTEPNAEVLLFDTNGYTPTFGKRTSYDQIMKEVNKHGGGTDCSIPYLYASKYKKKFDAVVVLTDSETWAGKKHPVVEYNKLGNVKNILVATTATKNTIMDDSVPNTLNIVGFDSTTVNVINDFIKE